MLYSPHMQQGKNIARWVALGALFLIPITPLVVTNSFFFPFITGKAFYFRILVEILVCAWVVLALIDREYRPRFSWIGIAVLAFVAWMFIADLFAVNVLKAFWSNFERMEGWILLIHLLGLFFASSAMLRVEKKWREWFLWSVTVSLVIVFYSFLQLGGVAKIHQGSNRIDASFGNSAYLAIYLLFTTFVSLWLALTEERPWLKWSLYALGVIAAILIFYTETRGTIIGLAAGVALASFLAAIAWSGRARRYALTTLIALLLLVGGFLLIKNTSFVRNSEILNRLASISLADGQVRFTLWHMAWEGVTASPKDVIVGYGQEGYNYIFNKYYDPSLYGQEQWFDRAHNAFIDWLVAGGFPAFLLYLSLFITALVALWKSALSQPEKIALTAAIVGYACHNMFVFDNLYSYVYFFAILALIDSQVGRPILFFERAPVIDASGVAIALPIAGACALVLIGFINYPGMHTAGELIQALSPQQNGAAQNLAIFEDLAKHPAFAGQEVREQIVSFASSVASSNGQVDATTTAAITSFAVAQIQLQIEQHPGDARTELELATAYNAAGDTTDALKAIQAAEALSPDKEDIYIQEGAADWDLQNFAAAKAAFDKAYALAPSFTDLATYAAVGDFITNDKAAADKILLAAYGTTTVDSDILALAYYRTLDYPDLLSLWRLRASAPTATASDAFGLAAAYYLAGEKQQAIAQVNAGIAKYPASATEGQQLLSEIEAGQ